MRDSHGSQDGTQGEGAPLTSYLRDGFLLLPQRLESLIVLQRSGATGESLSCTEYENLGGFLPLLMRSRGPISTSTHFLLLIGTKVQPEGRSGRPCAPCTCAQQRVLPVLQVSVEPLYAVALQVVPTVPRSTALLKLELGGLSHPVHCGPGAQVLVQSKVIIAVISNIPEPEAITFFFFLLKTLFYLFIYFYFFPFLKILFYF